MSELANCNDFYEKALKKDLDKPSKKLVVKDIETDEEKKNLTKPIESLLILSPRFYTVRK